MVGWVDVGSRVCKYNCSNDSTEVTEGVTSTPEIFGNKHSFVLIFFTTNTIYVNCKHCKPYVIKELYCTTKQEEGKLRSKAIMDLSFPGPRTATATSCIPHDRVYMPGPRAGKSVWLFSL